MPSTRSSAGTRAGLVLLSVGVAAAGCAYAAAIVSGSAPAWAPWSLAFGASAASTSLFVMGAATRGRLSRRIVALLAGLFLVLVAAFGAALAMPSDEGAAGRLLFGLPVRLAIVFYGVGFVPLVALPLAFALTFDRVSDRDADRAAGT